jgi:predicted acyltransferase
MLSGQDTLEGMSGLSQSENSAPPARLASLDMFRGLAIAGMVLVNNPGSWQHVYPPLLHAEWNGFTPTDLVFPAFLFAVGMAIPFTLAGYAEGGPGARARLYRRILRRVALLFALGLLLNATTPVLQWALYGKTVDWGNLRILGVLQRIALAYLIAMIPILAFGNRGRAVTVAALLFGYWGLMTLVPVPGYGAGVLTPDGSLAAYIDRLILSPPHLYQGRLFDPEGLLGTFPAAATVLIGFFTGDALRRAPRTRRVTGLLVGAGVLCLVIGWGWGLLFPINKQLWTSSYVAYSAGWCLLVTAACHEMVEVRRWRRIGWPFQVLGVNAIALFVGSGIAARILLVSRTVDGHSLYQWLYDSLFVPWTGPLNGSLAFALATVAVWWLLLFLLYRRGWFLRL